MNPDLQSQSLDRFDYEILKILQDDNLTSQKEISEQVNLSTTAVHRRIRRLNESGVIQKNVAVINPEVVGQALTLVVEISLADKHFRTTDEAKKVFLTIPAIQQCYHVTGDADFILVIALKSMAEYTALNRQLFETNPNIHAIKTFVTLDRVKAGLQVTL